MKKSFLLLLTIIISSMILMSCNHKKEGQVEDQLKQITLVEKSNNNNESKKTSKERYVLQASDISQFPEISDWQPEQIKQGYTIPQFLIDIYKKNGIDGKGMTINLPNGKNIATLCIDKNGQYIFRGNAVLFKNDNESITVLKEAINGRKFVGCAYDNDGNYNLKIIHMDYIDNSEAKLIDYADDFTIIYFPETSEVACIRYGEEIGPRTKIDANLLQPGSFSYEYKDGTMRYNDGFNKLTIGFINEGRLIYPIILKNGEEVSFHLYVAAVFDENVEEDKNTEINDIRYGIYKGKAYAIQNVVKQQHSIRGTKLIVEDTNIQLQVQEIEE